MQRVQDQREKDANLQPTLIQLREEVKRSQKQMKEDESSVSKLTEEMDSHEVRRRCCRVERALFPDAAFSRARQDTVQCLRNEIERLQKVCLRRLSARHANTMPVT